jgi:hypothetical protein
LTGLKNVPNLSLMFPITYIQIPEKYDAKGFLALAKSGIPVSCLPENTYGVHPEQLKILKRKRIPFKKLPADNIRLPRPTLAV